MCIEYARNVMDIKHATTYEIAIYREPPKKELESEEDFRKRLNKRKTTTKNEVYVIDDMPDAKLGDIGGTMRKGAKETHLKNKASLAYKLYDKELLDERYRHRFECSLDYVSKFKKAGLKFSGVDETGKRMEILELPRSEHKYFIGV